MGKKQKNNKEQKKHKSEPKDSKHSEEIKPKTRYGSKSKSIIKKKIEEKPLLIKNPQHIIMSKKVLIPLKKLNIQLEKDIKNMTIDEIKEFASNFDLNPKINFQLLTYLKKNSRTEYNKYINKYKYTLDFQDAIKLKCFKEKDINLIKIKFKENITKYNIKIGVINSLSRMKLFNMLFFLLNEVTISDLKLTENILSYAIPETLIFKIPNRFGNFELKYYTYITFFVNHLLSGIKNDANDDNVKFEDKFNDFTSSSDEQVYFSWNHTIKGEIKNVNLTGFYERKKILDDYVEINKLKDNKIKSSKKSEDLNKTKKNKIQDFIMLMEKINRLKIFKERILEIANESDESVLKKIKFIYYSLLFPPGNLFFDFLTSYSKCLKSKYSEFEINEKKKIFKDITCNENLAYENINSGYKNSMAKPFNFNSYYYTFPTLLEKNILQNDNDILRLLSNI